MVVPTALVGVLGAYAAGMGILSANDAATVSLTDDGVLTSLLGMAGYITAIALLGLGLGILLRSVAGSIGAVVGGIMILPNIAALLPDSWDHPASSPAPPPRPSPRWRRGQQHTQRRRRGWWSCRVGRGRTGRGHGDDAPPGRVSQSRRLRTVRKAPMIEALPAPKTPSPWVGAPSGRRSAWPSSRGWRPRRGR